MSWRVWKFSYFSFNLSLPCYPCQNVASLPKADLLKSILYANLISLMDKVYFCFRWWLLTQFVSHICETWVKDILKNSFIFFFSDLLLCYCIIVVYALMLFCDVSFIISFATNVMIKYLCWFYICHGENQKLYG